MTGTGSSSARTAEAMQNQRVKRVSAAASVAADPSLFGIGKMLQEIGRQLRPLALGERFQRLRKRFVGRRARLENRHLHPTRAHGVETLREKGDDRLVGLRF